MNDKYELLINKNDTFSIWRINRTDKSHTVERIKQSNFDDIWKKECMNNGKEIDDAIGNRCIKYQKNKLNVIPQLYLNNNYKNVRFVTINSKNYVYYFGYNLSKAFFEELSKEGKK